MARKLINTRRNARSSISAQAAPSWRDVLPVHPAADLFPLLSKGDLEELSRDITENGLRQHCHIIADEDGRPVLLDGRNRLDALEHIGEKITLNNSDIFEQLPADVDPYAFVISANIHRRHLTGEQKRELIGKLLKTTPEKSNRQIAKTVKADDKTVGIGAARLGSNCGNSAVDQDCRQGSQGATIQTKTPTDQAPQNKGRREICGIQTAAGRDRP